MRCTSRPLAPLAFALAVLTAMSTEAKPVSGVVKDLQSNLPVSNVVVKIFETGDSTLTDGAGVYFFPDVALGGYTFMFGKNSYVPKISTNVSVSNSCCIGTTSNVNMAGIVDGGDLALLVAYLTNPPLSKPVLPCPGEANVNAAGIIDGGDLALLVAYLTNPPGSKPTLPNCP